MTKNTILFSAGALILIVVIVLLVVYKHNENTAVKILPAQPAPTALTRGGTGLSLPTVTDNVNNQLAKGLNEGINVRPGSNLPNTYNPGEVLQTKQLTDNQVMDFFNKNIMPLIGDWEKEISTIKAGSNLATQNYQNLCRDYLTKVFPRNAFTAIKNKDQLALQKAIEDMNAVIEKNGAYASGDQKFKQQQEAKNLKTFISML